MGNCKDCKFWDRAWLDSKTKMAECDAFGYFDPAWGEKLEDDAAFDLSENEDYTLLEHRFMTGPMFGCVKFQSRG